MTATALTALNPEKLKQYCSQSRNDLGEKRNYDYGFRDYSPVAMRFTTVDPIKAGTNWYAYVGNDPINFIDPFGLCSESDNGYSPNADLLAEGLYNLGGATTQFLFGLGLFSIPTGATQVIGGAIMLDSFADGALAIGQTLEGAMGVDEGQVPSDLLGELTTVVTGSEEAGDFVEFATDFFGEGW